MMLDPRYTAIIAAATAAAAAINPQGVAGVSALAALLQAATDLHANYASGDVTDADLGAMMAKLDANMAGLRADIAAQGGAIA